MQRVQCSVISNCDSANYYEQTAISASVLKEIYHKTVLIYNFYLGSASFIKY